MSKAITGREAQTEFQDKPGLTIQYAISGFLVYLGSNGGAVIFSHDKSEGNSRSLDIVLDWLAKNSD